MKVIGHNGIEFTLISIATGEEVEVTHRVKDHHGRWHIVRDAEPPKDETDAGCIYTTEGKIGRKSLPSAFGCRWKKPDEVCTGYSEWEAAINEISLGFHERKSSDFAISIYFAGRELGYWDHIEQRGVVRG
jgi:hypothetical protein